MPSAATSIAPQAVARSQQRSTREARRWRKLWFFVGVSALAGASSVSALRSATFASITDVRSGSPGYRLSSTGRQQHWSAPSVTVYLDDSLKKLGPDAEEAVMQAFGAWLGSDARVPALRFDRGGTSSEPRHDGKSTVSFGPIKLAGHEKDVAVTVTYADDKTGEILEADVVLNSLYPMGVLKTKSRQSGEDSTAVRNDDTDDCRNRYDAQNVATHEAGHFFGLGEDMTERKAAMFLSIDQCETHKRQLAFTDVGALSTLYANEPIQEPQAGARGCAFSAAATPGSSALASALFLGLSLIRRRRGR